jgi:hypothetical protein
MMRSPSVPGDDGYIRRVPAATLLCPPFYHPPKEQKMVVVRFVELIEQN